MPFDVSTNYDLDVYRAVTAMSVFRGHPKRNLILYGALTLWVALCLALVIALNMEGTVFPMALMTGLMVIIDVFFAAAYFFLPKWQYKKASHDGETVVRFSFTDEGCHVEAKTDSSSSVSEWKYPYLYMAAEWGDFLLLYPAPNAAFAINKKNLTEENLGALRGKLFATLGPKKYKQYGGFHG